MVFHYLKSYIDTQHPNVFLIIILKNTLNSNNNLPSSSCPSYHLRNSTLISLLLPNTLFSRAIFYTLYSNQQSFKIKITISFNAHLAKYLSKLTRLKFLFYCFSTCKHFNFRAFWIYNKLKGRQSSHMFLVPTYGSFSHYQLSTRVVHFLQLVDLS